MLPPGLAYLESWVDERGLNRCFQLMKTEEPSVFDQWIANWSDLVEFEIGPRYQLRQRRRPHGRLISCEPRRKRSVRPQSSRCHDRHRQRASSREGVAMRIRARGTR